MIRADVLIKSYSFSQVLLSFPIVSFLRNQYIEKVSLKPKFTLDGLFLSNTYSIHPMKTHTTNYFNTFIAVADDCPALSGIDPPVKGDDKTMANLQFVMLNGNPYKYTSDELLFRLNALRKGFSESELPEERMVFFSKGQPCLRSSPLTKRYGWGIHSYSEGRVALYGVGTPEYKHFVNQSGLTVVKAMRSKKG